MYGYDYTTDYEMATGILRGIGVILSVIIIISLIVSIITLISQWKIYKKAGKGGWEAIIPIYNIIVLLQIVELPMWYLVLLIVPIANIYAMFKIYIELAHKFGKSTGFGVLTVFFNFICLPILAFSKNCVYNSTGDINTPQNNINVENNILNNQQPITFNQEANNQTNTEQDMFGFTPQQSVVNEPQVPNIIPNTNEMPQTEQPLPQNNINVENNILNNQQPITFNQEANNQTNTEQDMFGFIPQQPVVNEPQVPNIIPNTNEMPQTLQPEQVNIQPQINQTPIEQPITPSINVIPNMGETLQPMPPQPTVNVQSPNLQQQSTQQNPMNNQNM